MTETDPDGSNLQLNLGPLCPPHLACRNVGVLFDIRMIFCQFETPQKGLTGHI